MKHRACRDALQLFPFQFYYLPNGLTLPSGPTGKFRHVIVCGVGIRLRTVVRGYIVVAFFVLESNTVGFVLLNKMSQVLAVCTVKLVFETLKVISAIVPHR